MSSHETFLQEMNNDAVEGLKNMLLMRDNTVSNIYTYFIIKCLILKILIFATFWSHGIEF
jgi:hypothetical protein